MKYIVMAFLIAAGLCLAIFLTNGTAVKQAKSRGAAGAAEYLEDHKAELQGKDGKDGRDGKDGLDGVGIWDLANCKILGCCFDEPCQPPVVAKTEPGKGKPQQPGKGGGKKGGGGKAPVLTKSPLVFQQVIVEGHEVEPSQPVRFEGDPIFTVGHIEAGAVIAPIIVQ